MHGSALKQTGGEVAKFSKKNNIGNSTYEVSLYQLKKGNDNLRIMDLVNDGIVDEAKLVNPKNKKRCFNSSHNPEIKIYRDTDYVYYYSVSLENNQCDLSSDNLIISTLPQGVNP